MERKDIEKDIQRIFKENNIWYVWGVCLDGTVDVDVYLGDWKHDHLHLDHVMRENGYIPAGETVTDTDGSDAYSSIHRYRRMECTE